MRVEKELGKEMEPKDKTKKVARLSLRSLLEKEAGSMGGGETGDASQRTAGPNELGGALSGLCPPGNGQGGRLAAGEREKNGGSEGDVPR